MPDSRRVLLLDDDGRFRRHAASFLKGRGLEVVELAPGPEPAKDVERVAPQVVVVDLGLMNRCGIDLVKQIRSVPSRPQVICMTAGAPLADVVSAVQEGAIEVLERPVDRDRLARAIESAKPRGVSPSDQAKAVLSVDPTVDKGCFESVAARTALTQVSRQGDHITVVLEGELDCGQRALASAYHGKGVASDGPLVVVPATSAAGRSPYQDLFGGPDELSAFARAKGGVVFVESLSSIGEAGIERLTKLLEGLVAARHAGASVRWPPLVLGVERPLEVERKSGRIPEELFNILSQMVVRVPPMRDRPEDVSALVDRVLRAAAARVRPRAVAADPVVKEQLLQRPWERNAAEVVSTVRRALVLDKEGTLRIDLSLLEQPVPEEAANDAQPAAKAQSADWSPTLDPDGNVQNYDIYEAQIFRFALSQAGGCVSRAAELLGVGRATMYRKMRAYDLTVPPVAERGLGRRRRKKRGGDVASAA